MDHHTLEAGRKAHQSKCFDNIKDEANSPYANNINNIVYMFQKFIEKLMKYLLKIHAPLIKASSIHTVIPNANKRVFSM